MSRVHSSMDPVSALTLPLPSRLSAPADDLLLAVFATAAAGDREALARLYDLVASELYGFALWRTGRVEVAEDAVQEVFCRLASGRLGRGDVRTPLAWLLAATRNAAVDRLRRARREVALECAPALFAADDPERGEEARRLSRAVLDLPPRQREAIYLHYFSELNFRAAARILGVPTFTVASRCRLGVAKLRRRLGVVQ